MDRTGNDENFGLLRVQDFILALPLSVLREVVPCPDELAALPVRADGLLGAMELRSLIIPVVDLRLLLGLAADRQPHQVVVVCFVDGQLLGILADEVRGVVPARQDTLSVLRLPVHSSLISGAFRHSSTGDIVSILDAAALMALPGMPSVTARNSESEGERLRHGSRSPRPSGRPMTLLRCGDYTLAMDVASVHTTIPGAVADSSVLSGNLCMGVTSYASWQIPLVDPLALLGIGSMPSARGPSTPAMVLDLGRGYVALALDELLEIVDVSDDAVLPVPPLAVTRPSLLAGVAHLDRAGTCLMLDGAALCDEPELRALAGMNVEVGDCAETGGAGAAGRVGVAPSYLVCDIGIDIASPLSQISEILPVPEQVAPLGGSAHVVGVVVHRSAAVPVVCLAALLGLPETSVTARTCLVVVEVDGEPVAYRIAAVSTIGPLAWTDPDHQARESAGAEAGTISGSPLVRIGEDSRLLPGLDLHAVTRRLRGSWSSEPAAAPVPEQSRGEASFA